MFHTKKFVINSKAWKIMIKEFRLNTGSILKRAGLQEDLFLSDETSLTAEEYFRLWLSTEL